MFQNEYLMSICVKTLPKIKHKTHQKNNKTTSKNRERLTVYSLWEGFNQFLDLNTVLLPIFTLRVPS